MKTAVSTKFGTSNVLRIMDVQNPIPKENEILTNGASGSAGTTGFQIARAFGASVTGVCSTPKLELMRSFWADRVIDYTEEDFTTTSSKSFNSVVDVSGKSFYTRSGRMLKPHGRIFRTFPHRRLFFIWR